MSLIVISCQKKYVTSIIIKNNTSSEINLFKGEYKVHFMNKEDFTCSFIITPKEIFEIKQVIQNEGVFSYPKVKTIVDEDSKIMPVTTIKYIVNFSDGSNRTIDLISDFRNNPIENIKDKKLKKVLKIINKTVESKNEIQSAPKTDYFYL